MAPVTVVCNEVENFYIDFTQLNELFMSVKVTFARRKDTRGIAKREK